MRRKRAVVVAGTVIALALGGGVAYAYFTSTGSGTGQATVGTSGDWLVAQDGPAVGEMTPGGGTSVVPFSITNDGDGNQAYATLTATVDADEGDITEDGTAVDGCLAVWFGAVAGTPSTAPGTSVAPGGEVTVDVTVTMTNAPVNQDICKDALPDITLSVDTP